MNENILEKNLRAIRGRDPALAKRILELPPSPRIKRERGADHRISIFVSGPGGDGSLRLPDLGQPALDKMAERLSSARMAVVMGFGSGRLFAEVVERAGPQTFVLLVEPDIDLFAAMIREEDFSRAFGLERVSLGVGEKPHAATIIRTEEAYALFTVSSFPILENPWSARLYPDYFSQARERLAELARMGAQNATTIETLGAEWRKNIFDNLPAIIKSPPVSSLFGKFMGIPCVIVAAGPSLDKNMRLLASLTGRAIIIAVDTAVRPLITAGVNPDIVVALDSQTENYFHLAGVDLPDALYALNPVVNPRIVKERNGPMVFCGYAEPLFEWVESVIGERGSVRAGGSVATSAFDLAAKMGCSPIIFTGQDLCYSANATHAEGTTHSAISATAGGLPPGAVSNSFASSGIFGQHVLTTDKMEGWRKWFELLIPPSGSLALNATEGGRAITGAENVSLADAAARHIPNRAGLITAPANVIEGFSTGTTAFNAVAEALKQARDEARSVKNACGKGMNAIKSAMEIFEGRARARHGATANSLAEMSDRSRDILLNEIFTRTNRFHMDKALDRVEEINRNADYLPDRDRLLLNIEGYRELFTGIYEVASAFERDAAKALNEIGRMTA